MERVPLFEAEELADIRSNFLRLESLLDPDENLNCLDSWEKHDAWMFSLVTHPKLLDCVEAALGPNFYQWSSQIICKWPGDEIYVPWHQDLGDWPLAPIDKVATVWIALDDTDRENGCMWMIPESHLLGPIAHRYERKDSPDGARALAPFFVEDELLRAHGVEVSRAIPIELRAGEASIHEMRTVHGSGPNRSARRRCGFAVSYAATEVRCDMHASSNNNDWSRFGRFMCRGVDAYRWHPEHPIPTGLGRAPRKAYRMTGTMGAP